jgi:hypothetical protein
MNFLRKKRWRFLLGVSFCTLLVPVVSKSLPIERERECYRSFFPKESFQQRLKKAPSAWMLAQLEKDLAPFFERKISSHSVDRTYARIYESLGPACDYYHFRILDNKLYKYVPDGIAFSDTDTMTEKAYKTLLMYAKVPDCDFVLCAMDGVPESYVPADFYLVENPEEQAPVFAQARREPMASRYTVLVPDQLSLSEKWLSASQEILAANEKIRWDQKAPIAIWRGWLSDTGEPTDGRVASNYTATPRFNLCRIGSEHPECIDAGLCNLESPDLIEIAKKWGISKPSLSKEDHLLGKYLPVLDGHMCTYPGYQWRLLSDSVCLKQDSDQVQWFYKALLPFVHYIPIKNDMSDLLEQINWAKDHDEEVAEMVNRSRQFASENLLYEDVYFYLHLALSLYAQLQNIDFSQLKKETKKDPHWKCIQYRKRLALEKSVHKLQAKFF